MHSDRHSSASSTLLAPFRFCEVHLTCPLDRGKPSFIAVPYQNYRRSQQHLSTWCVYSRGSQACLFKGILLSSMKCQGTPPVLLTEWLGVMFGGNGGVKQATLITTWSTLCAIVMSQEKTASKPKQMPRQNHSSQCLSHEDEYNTSSEEVLELAPTLLWVQ